ncbi:ribosomal protein S18 acetylase RimI-like enzyme [Arthrobacter sp. SORGH_AS 212]|uniref:GNAT family N-acetyltransferase n=1 Tax=Pseudarthrobacter TaxID=1742993 RepID=UPI0021C025CE|nr:GNAT family N-acetyltransferase [Pseudarthrobacter equi]MDQ1055858.1 ribosomal protein S18 acetylase RimI-like enzyme [Arthrobacter sp. SORGH_AS_0212]
MSTTALDDDVAGFPGLEAAMDAAWPAPERHDLGPWVLRAAGGVTQRANSVWPRPASGAGEPELSGLLRDARSWYRSRRLPLIFQVTATAEADALNSFLDMQGFTTQSETLIMTRGPWRQARIRERRPAVELDSVPSAEWLAVWWAVDGRGGDDALAIARTILQGCPAVYALVRDSAGRPAAVGRLALPDTGPGARGGLYSMATSPEARRRGYGTAVLDALLTAGAERDLAGYWLLVTAANHGAQALYANAGFRETGRYAYRQERPKRQLTGC